MHRLRLAQRDGARIAVLFIGFEWYPEHPRVFFCFRGCLLCPDVHRWGGRLPWRIKLRDYLASVLISVGVMGVGLLIALYEAGKAR